MDKVRSDIYIIFPVKKTKEIKIHTIESEVYHHFMKLLTAQIEYECTKIVGKDVERVFLGEFQFASLNDDYTKEYSEHTGIPLEKVVEKQDAFMYLSSHKGSDLHLLTLVVHQNKFDISGTGDQISAEELYISTKEGSLFLHLNQVLEENFSLIPMERPKFIVCMKEKPSSNRELGCILSGESFCSEQVDYIQDSPEIKELLQKNVAQYSFYECYVSSRCLVYIFEDFQEDFLENLEEEVAIVFICEFILFQNAAISRANRKIVEELIIGNRIELKTIEKLYIEFGKTVVFWDIDNFKYLLPQNLCNQILEAFRSHELLDTYYRNQAHLEHIVELRNSQASEREGKVINFIAIFLTILQVLPMLGDGSLTFLIKIPQDEGAMFGCGLFVVFLCVYYKYHKNKKNKSNKRTY